MRGTKTDEKLSLQDIADKTEGYSGAELEQLVNEAKISAGAQRRLIVSEEDFSYALHRLSPEQERDRIKLVSNAKTQIEETSFIR
ncbi:MULTISPECIES: hypothetical protein [Wolbachia]|nr:MULTISPECIES: hypothetical protein [Wolbachia]